MHGIKAAVDISQNDLETFAKGQVLQVKKYMCKNSCLPIMSGGN